MPLASPATTCIEVGGQVTCTPVGPGPLVSGLLVGVIVFVVGQLYWRVIMEFIMVVFGIHEAVRSIEHRG